VLQAPEALFRLLAKLKCQRHSHPVRALTSAKALDYRDGTQQRLALVVVEKIADSEGVENIRDIDRYHVFGDVWDWGDPQRQRDMVYARQISRRLGRVSRRSSGRALGGPYGIGSPFEKSSSSDVSLPPQWIRCPQHPFPPAVLLPQSVRARIRWAILNVGF
jgi:hypothetical protein